MKSIKTTWRNIRRSPYQAMAAILVMSLTFLIVSLFVFILFGTARVVEFFESKPQVQAFFKEDVKDSDVIAFKNELQKSTSISSIRFVSKQEALKIYQQQNKNEPLLLDLVTADILPSSLDISTYKIEDLTQVSNTLRSSPLVLKVVFQKDVVSTLTTWTNALRKIGIFSILILSLVSVFIMVTVISIKISQKKEDIEIMRLIGANNSYIRWPFLFEGIFYGLIGAFIGLVISFAGLWYSSPFLSEFLKGIPVFPIPPIFILAMIGFEALLAVFLGTLSSYLAVRRYLKKS